MSLLLFTVATPHAQWAKQDDNMEKMKDKKRWSLKNLHMFHRKSVDDAGFYGSSEDRERKAKSSIDLRSNGEQTPSPPPSGKKRRFWSSFRNKKRLLVKSRPKDEERSGLSISQPNISNDTSLTSTVEDFDPEFDSPNKSSGPINSTSSPDRSLSDPSVTPGRHFEDSRQSIRSQSVEEHDREDEGDSGIAVVENTNSSVTVSVHVCQM